jgi:hypothetical protein
MKNGVWSYPCSYLVTYDFLFILLIHYVHIHVTEHCWEYEKS